MLLVFRFQCFDATVYTVNKVIQWQERSFSVLQSFGAGATLQLCIVTWHVASPWRHGLMICNQLCVILIFKLPRKHVCRGSKLIILIIIRWFIPRKFANTANAHLVDTSEEESFQFIYTLIVVCPVNAAQPADYSTQQNRWPGNSGRPCSWNMKLMQTGGP